MHFPISDKLKDTALYSKCTTLQRSSSICVSAHACA